MADLTSLLELFSRHGKRAMITGAASGIGKAIARRFAEAGAALELVDLDAERLATAQREFESGAGGARAHVVNLPLLGVLDVPGDDRPQAQEGRHHHQHRVN